MDKKNNTDKPWKPKPKSQPEVIPQVDPTEPFNPNEQPEIDPDEQPDINPDEQPAINPDENPFIAPPEEFPSPGGSTNTY